MPDLLPLTDRRNFYILTVKEVTHMKKHDFLSLLRLMVTPLVLLVLGVLLLFCPDSAAALVVKGLGWVLILAAVGLAVWAIAVKGGIVAKVLGAVICGLAGIWMVTHPLELAAFVGRLVGILMLIQGVQDLIYFRSRRSSPFLPLLCTIAGIVLVVLPMTTSRLVFRGIGGIVLVIGAVMLYDRIRCFRQARKPQDPNIIDAL